MKANRTVALNHVDKLVDRLNVVRFIVSPQHLPQSLVERRCVLNPSAILLNFNQEIRQRILDDLLILPVVTPLIQTECDQNADNNQGRFDQNLRKPNGGCF